jgi:glycosyltransferase involved in cell wall biosynthesis
MGRAGAETALIGLLRKLTSMGQYDLSLYTIIPCGELFDRIPEGIHILNQHIKKGSVLSLSGHLRIVREVIYSFFYHFTGLKMFGYMIRNIREQRASGRKLQYDKLLWRLLATGRPGLAETYDLAVAFIEGAATYYLADKVKARHKAAFIHIDYQKAGYSQLMDQDCYHDVERIFVVSREVGEKFISVYPKYQDKVRVFHNLIDRDEIRKKAEEGSGFTDRFDGCRLLTVGRLHYQKGYDIAIQALAKIREDGYHVRWYVIGEGLEKAKLEKLITKFRVEDCFILMGARENPYVYMKQSDIYVHATRFEGKSIAIEEAQILGKAIVASDGIGNDEQIVSGYDGILLTLNVEQLASVLEHLIDHPQLREEYARHALEKKVEFPEELEGMLSMLDEVRDL